MYTFRRRAQAIVIHNGRYVRVTYRRAKKKAIFQWKLLAAKMLSGELSTAQAIEEQVDHQIAEMCASYVVELEDGGEVSDRENVPDGVEWRPICFEVEDNEEGVPWSGLGVEDREDVVAYSMGLFVHMQGCIFQATEGKILKKS